MADIELTNLTDSTNANNGTGVFDKLIQSVEQHIESQYKAGRITGNDYSSVYLGSMQSVLSESVKFLLSEQQVEKEVDLISQQIISEQKKNEAGGLIDLEKKKNQEQIDLIIAQTASQYEGIDASRKDTNRKNLLNSKQVIKVGKETELLTTQNSELLLSGVVERSLKDAQRISTESGAIDNTNKANADVALTNSKEVDQIFVTSSIRPLEVTRLTTQNSEEVLNGVSERALKTEQKIAVTSGAVDSTNKVNADVALIGSKELDQKYVTTNVRPLEVSKLQGEIDFATSKKLDQIYVTASIRPLEKSKIEEEVDLLQSRDSEQLAATVRMDLESAKKVLLLGAQTVSTASGAVDNTKKVNSDIAYATSKELDQLYVTANIRPLEKSKVEEEVDLLQSRDSEQLKATIRMDLESAKKVLLIEAQTIGFKVDGKQKLLKQMFEGFAIETTTNGAVSAPAPSLNSSASLEMVANSIFDDLEPTGGTI